MRLRPFFLPMSTEPFSMCSAFLHQHIGYKPVEETDPEWLQSLALTFVVWYVHREGGASGPFDLFAHPPALSVALVTCAVASSSSAIQHHDDHLRSLADSIETDEASMAILGTLSINAVHDISELQLVYMSLLSLVRMIDLLNFTNGSAAFGNKSAKKAFTLMSFLPSWVPFASTRLLHHISVLTACQKVDERRQSAPKTWLPRLLDNELEVAKAEQVFTQLVDLANSMSTVRPIEFESRIETEAVPPQRTSNPIDDDQQRQFVHQRHSAHENGSNRLQTPYTSARSPLQSATTTTDVDPRSRSPNRDFARLRASQPHVMRGFVNRQRRPFRSRPISSGSPNRALGDVRAENPTTPSRGGFQPRHSCGPGRRSSLTAVRPLYSPYNQSASSALGQTATEAAVSRLLGDGSEVTKAEQVLAQLDDVANSMSTVHPIEFESRAEAVKAIPSQLISNRIDAYQRHSDPGNGSTKLQTPVTPPYMSARSPDQSGTTATDTDPRSRSPYRGVARLQTSQPQVMRGFVNRQRRPFRCGHISSGGPNRALGDVRAENRTPPSRGGFRPHRSLGPGRKSSFAAARPLFTPCNQSASSAWGQMAIEAAVQQLKATAINQE
uniref:Uncharacterized protein n=1 Tax=Schistocephalus solidus TaxID=70667 RepID=A0A0X3PD57_SCHSO